MFYTFTEKVRNTFFGDWRMRAVAFDTRRRYLYYSEPVPEVMLAAATPPAIRTPTAASAAAVAPSASSSPALPSQPSAATGNAVGVLASTTSATATAAATAAPSADDGSAEASHVPVTKLTWKAKIKVSSVVPVATVRTFNLADPRLAENDFYQLDIGGETRIMATGEVPPLGPLLCPSAGLAAVTSRCTLDNEEFIGDPFFLKGLFNALRDQFEELEKEQREAEAVAAAQGRPVVPSKTLTISSPRGNNGEAVVPGRKERVVLRCRNEREFRRFWYVLQTVLGYDRLIVRPYRGLPPYDPRNMVAFAHIPMTVWHTFNALDKAVFYIFTRGDTMVTHNARDELSVSLSGCYLCVTHDMVYFMRSTGNIPRWVRLQEVSEFHFSVTAARPFFALLCDPPAADVLFMPLPPVFGPIAAATFDPVFEVRRMQRVMHDTCFASVAIRRVVTITESRDVSAHAYMARMRASGRPLRLSAGAMHTSAMSCPLPKEQLAAVWHDVQTELRARAEAGIHAAIPLYEANAAELQLSGAQLSHIARRLDDERERIDDVVGMPLERAQRVAAAAAAAASQSTAGHVHGQGSLVGASARNSSSPLSLGSPSWPSHRTSHQQDGYTTAAGAPPWVMPPTTALLHTPQLMGTYQAEERRKTRSSSRASSSLPSPHASERSSYLVPGTRYITCAELERSAAGNGERLSTEELEAIAADRHEEVERESLCGAAAPSPMAACGNGGGSVAFRYGPERTVNEIVRESMAALERARHD